MKTEETRTYEITGYPEHLDILEKVFGKMEYFGSIGRSRRIKMFVDGDGAVRLKIRRNGQRLNHDDGIVGCGYLETDTLGNIKVDLG